MITVIKYLLNILYPRCCPVCHEILKDQDRVICERCAKTLKTIQEPRCCQCGKPVRKEEEYCKDCLAMHHVFEKGRGIFAYDDKMKLSLMKFKYFGCREYGDFYAEAMCLYGKKDLDRWRPDLIVPVPLHKSKERLRGFNQAAYLAERISRRTGIPVALSLVKKIRKTKSQKKLNAVQRHENLKNAFYVNNPVPGKRILVVDDVYTTGSTMDAMAVCLLENGAEKVYFLTVCIGKR